MRNMLNMIEFVRNELGPEIELLHDVHERLRPIDAVAFAKELEAFKLYFLEDVLAPGMPPICTSTFGPPISAYRNGAGFQT
jgi:L-alanine-DL-glutamate epimerase-like enolase superfamily enzyme